MDTPPLLGCDIGNTRIKLALFLHGAIHATRFISSHDAASWTNVVDELFLELNSAQKKQLRAAMVSVQPQACAELIKLLEPYLPTSPRIVRSDGELFATGLLQHELETPQTTGADRLLSALGALARAPGENVLVVDAGSAITVNLTTRDRVFLGGAIMPGLRLLSEALHRGTAALPIVNSPSQMPPPDPLGKSTRNAIAAGVYHAAVGGVTLLLQSLISRYSPPNVPRVFLTGGDAMVLHQGLTIPHGVCPWLVLEGLAVVMDT